MSIIWSLYPCDLLQKVKYFVTILLQFTNKNDVADMFFIIDMQYLPFFWYIFGDEKTLKRLV